MAKPRVLLQLDGDAHASSFDAIVAADSDVDHLLPYANVQPDQVRGLVHGAIFTRGPQDLHRTAIFIGGTDVGRGERLLSEVRATFFGPMRVSVMLDANGANTTAAAAVHCAVNHLDLADSKVLILAGTGAVGQRVARLVAPQASEVRVASRRLDRAEKVCVELRERIPDAQLHPVETDSEASTTAALESVDLVVAAGAAGVRLLESKTLAKASDLKVAVDLNAVPPLGIEPIEVTDRGAERNGVICYGAIGVGGTKMKLHKAALRRLFEAADRIFDAEEILALARELDD